jgi:large subunit ribosomal protein L18
MKTLKRRRKESKTDYGIRKNLLKSNRPRIIFRKSNRYLVAQYALSTNAQDKTLFSISSKELLSHGWPEEKKGSLKTLPAAYLTGMLFGKRILKEKGADPILDIGMRRSVNQNRIFAFIKGLIDAGVKIKSKEEAFPSSERIQGKHLKTDFSSSFGKIKSDIEGKK